MAAQISSRDEVRGFALVADQSLSEFENKPAEIITEIFSSSVLSVEDLLRLKSACKRFHAVIKGSQALINKIEFFKTLFTIVPKHGREALHVRSNIGMYQGWDEDNNNSQGLSENGKWINIVSTQAQDQLISQRFNAIAAKTFLLFKAVLVMDPSESEVNNPANRGKTFIFIFGAATVKQIDRSNWEKVYTNFSVRIVNYGREVDMGMCSPKLIEEKDLNVAPDAADKLKTLKLAKDACVVLNQRLIVEHTKYATSVETKPQEKGSCVVS